MSSNQEAKNIKLTIDSRLENIGLVGLAVQAISSYVGCSEVEAYQIQLSVVEAVTNVVRHAYNDQPGHEASVVVTLYPDRISFQVRDTGQAMNLMGQDPIEFDPSKLSDLPERGMGLYIIQTVMDELDYQLVDGTNLLTMTKYLSRD